MDIRLYFARVSPKIWVRHSEFFLYKMYRRVLFKNIRTFKEHLHRIVLYWCEGYIFRKYVCIGLSYFVRVTLGTAKKKCTVGFFNNSLLVHYIIQVNVEECIFSINTPVSPAFTMLFFLLYKYDANMQTMRRHLLKVISVSPP